MPASLISERKCGNLDIVCCGSHSKIILANIYTGPSPKIGDQEGRSNKGVHVV